MSYVSSLGSQFLSTKCCNTITFGTHPPNNSVSLRYHWSRYQRILFSFFFFFLAPRLLSFRDVLTRRKRYSLKTCESSLWMLETNEEFLKDVSSELCQSFVRFFFSFFLFLESIQVSSTKDHSNCQWCFFFLEAEKVWNFFHRKYSSIKVSFYNRGV